MGLSEFLRSAPTQAICATCTFSVTKGFRRVVYAPSTCVYSCGSDVWFASDRILFSSGLQLCPRVHWQCKGDWLKTAQSSAPFSPERRAVQPKISTLSRL